MITHEPLTVPPRTKCDAAKALVQDPIAKARDRFPDLELREVNLTDHPEVALRYGVLSTPALMINGRLEFTAVPKEAKLLARLNALTHSG